MAGVDAPDIAAQGEEFVVRLTGIGDASNVVCHVLAEPEQSIVIVPVLLKHEAELTANIVLAKPGIYRIQVKAGGTSPVEQLMMIIPNTN